MADFEVTSTDQFIRAARALNAQGSAGKGLKRELMAEIKTAVKPMENEVRRDLPQFLPRRYARVLGANLVVRPSQKTTGNSVGLKVTGYAPGQAQRRQVNPINAGILRHPVFGNRKVWIAQKVKAGFWSIPMERSRDIPAAAIRRAIQKTISKLT
jgi:hypothetical protein